MPRGLSERRQVCISSPSTIDIGSHSLSLHPILPILATASGQRRFAVAQGDLGSGSDSDEELFGESTDNSVKLWAAQATNTIEHVYEADD